MKRVKNSKRNPRKDIWTMSKFERTRKQLENHPKVKSAEISQNSHIIIRLKDGTSNSLGKKWAQYPYPRLLRLLSMS